MAVRGSIGDQPAAGYAAETGYPDDFDWTEPTKPKKDWKKAALVIGLGTLSWVATYIGMLELVQSNMGELSLIHKAVIGFSVAMLMTMIIWLLDQLFAPLPLTTKIAYLFGYMFLTLISVGFGFGFYWKVLESRSEASRSAESAIMQVQGALLAASSRLDQLQSTLDQLTTLSTQKAVIERERGASCPNSRPGDGPRRKLRDADAARFSFAANFVKGRGAKVNATMKGLDGDLKKITSGDPSIIDPTTGTRNAFLQGLTRKLELTATSFNAFRTDPQLRQIRSELAERSTQTTFPTGTGRGTFSCPDPQLQSALRGVVRAIDQLPELGKPQIATVEGAQAVVEAFRRLTATLFGVLSFKLPPSADELRALQQKAVQSVENAAARQAAINEQQGGLSKRDYIPLGIAMFVDLCLLLVSIGRPMNRLHNLVPKMREAERGPVFQILSRFDDIHRDPQVREKFEIFRHVVFDFNGDYYVAVPLDAPRNRSAEEAHQLQQEAHLLSNLFASFEKEKIFSRVYNPLLGRRMIERKLARQGSKFAQSSAFRIYRFRDGAWSDIILGAVMGAARRSSQQQRRAAAELGPHLDLPKTTPTAEPVYAADPTRKEQPVPAHETFETDDVVARMPPRRGPVDADLRAKYGPYADILPEALSFPDERAAKRKPDPTRWPYRSAASGPTGSDDTAPFDGREAEASDNVIPLPPQRSSSVQAPPSAAAMPSTPAAETVTPQAATEMTAPEVDVIAEAILAPAQEPGQQPARAPSETWINMRLTERTADFSVPVTDATLPDHLLGAFGKAGERLTAIDVKDEDAVAQHLVDDAAASRLIAVEEAPQSLPHNADEDPAEADSAPENDPFDPMLQAAHRFAARRTPGS